MPITIPGSVTSSPGEANTPGVNNLGAKNVLGYAPGSLVGTDSTSTSYVVSWLPDGLQIMEEAAQHAGFDLTTAYALRTAKYSMEMLSMMWANEGLNLWTLEEVSTPLVPGEANYIMPADTVDLISASIRTQVGVLPDGVTPRYTEILIARQDFDTYFSIPDKQSVGKPTTIFVQRSIPNPQFFVWQVPGNSPSYTLLWWRLRRMQNTGYSTNGADIPFRLIPAFTFGLAWQMSLKKKGPKDYNLINLLESNYQKAFTKGLNEDRDRSSVYFAPMIQWP